MSKLTLSARVGQEPLCSTETKCRRMGKNCSLTTFGLKTGSMQFAASRFYKKTHRVDRERLCLTKINRFMNVMLN